jgi:hypothetical protein
MGGTRSRALSRATAVAGHVTAWAGRAHARFRVDFELFEVRVLGRDRHLRGRLAGRTKLDMQRLFTFFSI